MRKSVTLLILGIFAVFLLSLRLGDQPIPYSQIIGVLTGDPDAAVAAQLIVLEVRLPRAILALLVGMALAVAGAIIQTVMRNPLAEPGLLGINSGGALAALILIVYFRNESAHLVPWAAFAGAFLMAAAIYGFSWRSGASPVRIILIGIGLGSMAGAGASFISAFGEIAVVQQAQVWLAGSVYNAGWDKVQVLAIWLVLPFVLTMAASRELDLLSFSEMSARSLGQRVEIARAVLILLCTMISGAAVAAAGLIGFIGLISPHVARRFVGHSHHRMVPVAALVGGFLVLTADLIGRTVMAPAQLPAGIVTAILGAPFFAFLLWERRYVRS